MNKHFFFHKFNFYVIKNSSFNLRSYDQNLSIYNFFFSNYLNSWNTLKKTKFSKITFFIIPLIPIDLFYKTNFFYKLCRRRKKKKFFFLKKKKKDLPFLYINSGFFGNLILINFLEMFLICSGLSNGFLKDYAVFRVDSLLNFDLGFTFFDTFKIKYNKNDFSFFFGKIILSCYAVEKYCCGIRGFKIEVPFNNFGWLNLSALSSWNTTVFLNFKKILKIKSLKANWIFLNAGCIVYLDKFRKNILVFGLLNIELFSLISLVWTQINAKYFFFGVIINIEISGLSLVYVPIFFEYLYPGMFVQACNSDFLNFVLKGMSFTFDKMKKYFLYNNLAVSLEYRYFFNSIHKRKYFKSIRKIKIYV